MFETNYFVFEEPKISCYQIESYIECNKVEQPACIAHEYLKWFTKTSLQQSHLYPCH